MDYNFLKHTELFKDMEEGEIKSVLSHFHGYEKTFENKEVIYSTGDVVDEIGLILEGSANAVAYDYWGNESILGSIKGGEVFAVPYAAIPGAKLQNDVVANKNCTVLFLNIKNMLKAGREESALMQNLFLISIKRTLNLHSRMKHISEKTIRGKLISYLSEQSVTRGSSTFTIPFNREQLAQYLCADRSALSNELSKMQREGMIEYKLNSFALKEIY